MTLTPSHYDRSLLRASLRDRALAVGGSNNTREDYRQRILGCLINRRGSVSCTDFFWRGFASERLLNGTLAWLLELGEVTASLREGYSLTALGRSRAQKLLLRKEA